MSSDLFGVIFAIVLIGGIVAYQVLTTRRRARLDAERRSAFSAYAEHREWEYRDSDRALVDHFPGAPFGRGHSQQARNVVLGRHEGRAFVAFDYRFTVSTRSGQTRNNKDYRYSVVALTLGLPTPGLTVSPTGSFGWVVNALTGRDVEIGHPLFDGTFTVTSPSPEFATDVLHPDVVGVALHHPHLAWRLEGDAMLVIREGEHSPQEIEAKLHFMDAVLDRVPQHVRDRLLGEPPR